jgi:alpha-N-arabinofuranosidase
MGISASAPRAVTGRVLTAPSMTSINTFEAPETVRPAPFSGIEKRGDRFVLTLPSKSVVVLELQ